MTRVQDKLRSDFRRILFSRFVSGIGDWGGLIAISNLSYNSSHSVKNLSLIYTAKIFSVLFSSIIQKTLLKTINQTFPIGKMLAILEAISALSLISILLVNTLNTTVLAGLYFLSAICSSIFLSITNTLITEMYPNQYKEHFRTVLFYKRAAFLIGPMVMGSIIGFFGNTFGIIADSLSFLFSGVFLYNIVSPINILFKSGNKVDPETSSAFELQKPKALLFLATAIIGFVGIAGGAVNSIELPYIITKLKLGSSFFGFSLALGGLGSIAGIILDKRIPNDYPVSKITFLTVTCILLSFIPWYFQSIYFFAFALIIFSLSITIFSNRTLFYLVDCYNGSPAVRHIFKNKPNLFLFYHQVDSLAMIIGAIISGIIADLFSTTESLHLIISCLLVTILANLLFTTLSARKETRSC